MDDIKQPVIPRLQASIMNRASSELDMAVQFLEEAVNLLKEIDRDDYPCSSDHIQYLESTLSRVDILCAILIKESHKRDEVSK